MTPLWWRHLHTDPNLFNPGCILSAADDDAGPCTCVWTNQNVFSEQGLYRCGKKPEEALDFTLLIMCVCVCVLSGGVIREDSPYSIAAVPTSAARCPRCRRYTAESAECLCPRCQTVVSQAHWQAKVSPWQLANITLDGFVSLLLVKLHGTAESRPVPRLQPLRDVHLTPNQLSLHSGLLIFWTLRAEPAAQHVVMGE